MNDEQRPTTPEGPRIRDPHAPVNLLRDFEPLEFPTVEKPRSLSDVADFDTMGGAGTGAMSPIGPAAGPAADGAGNASGAHVRIGDDPLARRPRTSSRVLCLLFALLFAAAAAGVYWFGARTETGQSYDDMVTTAFPSVTPGWMGPLLGAGTHWVVVGGSVALAAVAAIVAIARRRWWLVGQLVVFGILCGAAWTLKFVLPRPFIIRTEITDGNAAPSGHTVLAVAASVALLFAVSRGWRWVAALVGMLWSSFTGLSVVYGRWHRPSDALMAVALVGAVALLVLVATRASGMDATGKRRSSSGVQIVGSIAITAGTFACLYGAYMVWQVAPGLLMSAQWARSGAVLSASILIVGSVALVFGLLLAMRQVTAAPLTKLGLIGAPPAPPRRR